MGGALWPPSVLVLNPDPVPRSPTPVSTPLSPQLALQLSGVNADIPKERSAMSSTRRRAVLRRKRWDHGSGLGVGEEGRKHGPDRGRGDRDHRSGLRIGIDPSLDIRWVRRCRSAQLTAAGTPAGGAAPSSNATRGNP